MSGVVNRAHHGSFKRPRLDPDRTIASEPYEEGLVKGDWAEELPFLLRDDLWLELDTVEGDAHAEDGLHLAPLGHDRLDRQLATDMAAALELASCEANKQYAVMAAGPFAGQEDFFCFIVRPASPGQSSL